MKKEFKLVSCEPQHIEREVEVDGVAMNIPVPGVIAQFVPVNEDGTGSLKIAVAPDSREAFQANVGKVATLEISFAE